MCAPKPKSRRESKINLAGDDVTTRCDVMVVGDMIRDAPTGITGSVAFFRAERCVAVAVPSTSTLDSTTCCAVH